MARIRSIKPEFWDDRKLAQAVTRDARLLYIGLWNFADEHARCNGDSVWLAGHIFAYESDLGPDEVARYLDDLARCSRVVRYTVAGDPYLFLPKLAEHQRLEPHKVASKHPPPDEADDKPASDLHVYTDPSGAQILSDETQPGPDSSALLYVAGSMEHVAGSMEHVARDDPTGELLVEHSNAYGGVLTLSELAPVKIAILKLVSEGVPADRIRAGLARMRQRKVGAGLLPQMVTEATPTLTRSTTDDRVAQAQAVTNRYRAKEAGA